MATVLPVEEIHGSPWRSVQNWTVEGAVWAFGVSEGVDQGFAISHVPFFGVCVC